VVARPTLGKFLEGHMTRREKAKETKPKTYGIAADRYVVELRGSQFFVIDAQTGGIMGGPYSARGAMAAQGRAAAQARADSLNATVVRR
jgi:hypothetical protein